MDLPCTEWINYVEQKWTGLSSGGNESFCLLTDTEAIFNFGLSKTCHEDVEVLSRISKRYSVNKSNEKACEFRQRGNLSFRVKDYAAAALHYSKGVCYADNNTEELSLCYANRSAALYYHGHYKACLEDIQRSMEAGYPIKLQDKLKTRQSACLNELKKSDQSKTPISEVQTPPYLESQHSTNLHSACVYFSAEKGRHILVTENKAAGDILLEDKVFCSVLIPSKAFNTKDCKSEDVFGTEDQYCHHCLSQSLSLVPCPNCSYARYCGEACKTEAWEHWHQWECPIGADLLVIGVLGHLALRVTLKAGHEVQMLKKNSYENHIRFSSVKNDALVRLNLGEDCRGNPEHSDCFHGSSYLAIHSLLPHVTQHPPASRFLLAVTVAVLFRQLQGRPPPQTWLPCKDEGGQGMWKPEKSMLGATALRHLMQLRCNAQAVTALRVKDDVDKAVQSSCEVRIATALFPVLSLMNHSCNPNTSLSFCKSILLEPLNQSDTCKSLREHSKSSHGAVTVTVRATKALTPGQEILHCYGPHCSRMGVEERQRHLLEQYFFRCNCQACQPDHTEGSQNAEEKTAAGLKCEECGNPLQTCSVGYMCSRSSCVHQISTTDVKNKLQALQGLMDQAFCLLEKDKLDKALQILKSALSQANDILTKTHPLQGQLADSMARVYATRGEWSQAASNINRSLASIQAQFGEDSIEMGRQLFKLAQLHFNGLNGAGALAAIPRARRILLLHCDPRCEELKELEEMERCLEVLR